MHALRSGLFATVLLLAWASVETGQTLRAATANSQAETELRQAIIAGFPQWDRDHDNALDGREINASIENPQVRGVEAAAVVAIRKHLLLGGENTQDQKLPREVVLGLAHDRGAQRDFLQARNRIASGNRALFLPGDPNLFAFNQGHLGDCYLLSAIAAFVQRDHKAVQTLIKPKPGNTFEVNFASGRNVAVSPVTDAELVMGSKPGADRGIWLVVLEKAYASIREERPGTASGKSTKENDVVAMDLLGGGRSGPVIQQLTGNRTRSKSWNNEITKPALEQLHNLLDKLTRDRKLCAASTPKDRAWKLPKGIAHSHAMAVLGYDSPRRMVRLFNPWGNDVTPAGPPGLVNGYVTRQGSFEIPFADFVQAFRGIVYEADAVEKP